MYLSRDTPSESDLFVHVASNEGLAQAFSSPNAHFDLQILGGNRGKQTTHFVRFFLNLVLYRK